MPLNANRVAGSSVEKYLPLLNIPLDDYYFSRASHPGAPSNTGMTRRIRRVFAPLGGLRCGPSADT